MITDAQREDMINREFRGILKEEARSYEVSLWTLQDSFITVLKWSNAEQKGRIEDAKMILDVDGTEQLSFSIPMYIYVYVEGNRNSAFYKDQPHVIKKENPIWYNTQNGNLIAGMRKIKVIFNKDNIENKKVFEFIITEVTESHENDQLKCEVKCEGLAFHELGKIGYKINLSEDNFLLKYKAWAESENKDSNSEPIQNVQYWCGDADCCNLEYFPSNPAEINPNKWYYSIEMNWGSFKNGRSDRATNIVYEEEYTSSWDADLIPQAVDAYREKARPVTAENSNLYNITQDIAKAFEIYCRYEYGHDENNYITYKKIIFYNNYLEEQHGIMSLVYPYSAQSISRSMDNTNLTTKLYISSADDNSTLSGSISIMDTEANKTKEDYILNFDYLHEIGAISEEQYKEIAVYEKKMRELNDQLIPIGLQISNYEGKKIDEEAKIAVLDNSIDLDTEQIKYNSALYTKLDEADGVADGLIDITETGVLINSDTGYYLNLNSKKKGIVTDSFKIYKTISYDENKEPYFPEFLADGETPNEITNFLFEGIDDYGFPQKITGIVPWVEIVDDQVHTHNIVQLAYKYQPRLYYDAIIKTWESKLYDDQTNLTKHQDELSFIENKLSQLNETQAQLIAEKKNAIKAFEQMMGPALREGYWQPDDYKDYGDNKDIELILNNSYTENSIIADTGKGAIFAWDNIPLDDEDKLYYEVGVTQDKVYYPCILMDSFLNKGSTITNYSFIFKTNYYDTTQNSNDGINAAQYTRNFKVGSEALLRFAADSQGTVHPILVLVGAKNMTDEQISFMKGEKDENNQTKPGKPRLGIFSTEYNETTGKVELKITNKTNLSVSNFIDASQYTLVQPRIKFSSLNLKTSEDELFIRYANTLLERYKDYSVVTRITTRDEANYLEYFITLNPEVIWSKKNLNSLIKIDYALSNASTTVYLDALKVSKENAYPQVSYTITPNMVYKSFMTIAYNGLAQLVTINDTDLKFKDVFGYISHIELNLDNPNEDTYEIKNYKTKFEDLFSTIVAQTEALRRNEMNIASAAAGNVGLSSEGMSLSLSNNIDITSAFLDSYFDTSEVVENKLKSLFTEAGQILGNANKTIDELKTLTLDNANILSGFATNISRELSPNVIRSTTRPTDFKVGDIWIEVNEDGEEIGRYVATSESSEASPEYGYTRTFDGTLAMIKGANMSYDAVTGIVDIYGEHQINLRSGENVYIGADDTVSIVGNKSVNIGGTTINIGSTVINGASVTGGINLVTATYNSDKFDSTNESGISKVLIHPNQIYMSSSELKMYGTHIDMVASNGAANNTSAILLDANDGIWIGSGKSVTIFSGAVNNNGSTVGASVQLNNEHLLFGFSNIGENNTSVIKMTDKYFMVSVGNTFSNPTYNSWEQQHDYFKDDIIQYDGKIYKCKTDHTSSNNWVSSRWELYDPDELKDITLNGSITGVKITKDKIGLATGTGNSRAVILMGQGGIEIGAGNNPATNGSYVSISGSGISLGSHSDLYINTNNLKFQTNSQATDNNNGSPIGDTVLAIGANLHKINSNQGVTANTAITTIQDNDNKNGIDVRLVLNKNGLYIKGAIYATAFLLGPNATIPSKNIDGLETMINNTTKSTIKLYYLSSSTTAPNKPSSEVTLEATSNLNTWAQSIPQYISGTTAYYYYTCIQSTTEGGTVTWTNPTIDYGLTYAGQTATAASINASSARSITDAFTANGLLTDYWWPVGTGEQHTGGIKWNVALLSAVNPNNDSKGLLIGANSEIWIAKSSTYNDGAAIVLNHEGIAMNAATITLTSTSNNTTNVVSLNGAGINLGTSGTFEVASTNFLINSSAAGTDNMLRLGSSSSPVLSYSETGGLSINGAVHATSFELTNNAQVSGLGISHITGLQAALQEASTSGWSIDGLSNEEWPKLINNAVQNIESVTLGSSTALVLGANYGVYIPKSSLNDGGTLDDTYLNISKNGIYLDYNDTSYVHIDATGVDINGNKCWDGGDILYGTTRPTYTGDKDHWIWIMPTSNVTISYTGNGSSWGSGGASTNLNTYDQNLVQNFAIDTSNQTSYNYTLTIRLNINTNSQTWVSSNFTPTLSKGDTAIETNKVVFAAKSSSFRKNSTTATLTYTTTSNNNLVRGTTDPINLFVAVDEQAFHYGNTTITSASLMIETAGTIAGQALCNVYYMTNTNT